MRARFCMVAPFVLLAGCTLVADFGQYSARDASVDAAADAGDVCGDRVCASGEACCVGSCVPLGTLTDCGSCDDVCEEGLNSDPVCMSGTCGAMCDVGFGDCDDNPANGCEQALNTADHCGGCGMACGGAQLCAAIEGVTRCVDACPPGQTSCGRGCFDLDSSALHCGECSRRCRVPVGGGLPMCVDGVCEDGCPDGMGDCDSEPSDCEATLVMRFEDLDDDGFGRAGTAYLTCPAEPFTSGNADDCDDTHGGISPAATEVCDTVDNNCSGTIDDAATVGDVCTCEPGSAAGEFACGSEPAPVCSYPTDELCNGLDDNCDGDADETFSCVLGDERDCTLPEVGGCTPVGHQTCDATCAGYGACVPADLCNRVDDDCDDKVDEDVLAAGAAPRTLALGAGARGLRAHFNPDLGQLGIVYAVGSELRFASVNVDGTPAISPFLVRGGVVVTRRGAGDVTWVGSHWVVSYVSSVTGEDRAQVIVIGPDGSLGMNEVLSGSEPITTRVDRIGARNEALVAWTRDNGRQFRNAVVTVSSTGSLAVNEDRFDAGGSSRPWREFDVVTTSTGAFVAAVQLESTFAVVRFGESTGSPIENSETLMLDGRIEYDVELAYDPMSDRIGMLYGATSDAGEPGDLLLASFAPGMRNPEVQTLGSDSPSREHLGIAAANDGAFGVLYPGAGSPQFARHSAENLSDWTQLMAADSVDDHLIGVPTGDVHYLMFGTTAAGGLAQPVSCL